MLYEISIILGVAKIKGIQLKNIVKRLNNSYLTEQKCFQIVLGSDYNVKCQSLRDAKRFLAETNRLLNQKVNLLCSCATKVCNVYYSLTQQHPG